MVENVQKLTFKGHVGHFSRKECFKMKISTFFKDKYNFRLNETSPVQLCETFLEFFSIPKKLVPISKGGLSFF